MILEFSKSIRMDTTSVLDLNATVTDIPSVKNTAETSTQLCYTVSNQHDDIEEAWIDDATWILTSSFIIFTMQSGFGLLESGMASRKNEANIMVKNVVDVVFGGLTYWAIGYGLTFGDSPGSNAFTGVGSFFLDPVEKDMGTVFSKFIFQASFCTTATTIVSGAVAERTKLTAYIAFCLLNTLVYSFPAHWVWAPNGWLKQLHVVDVAGIGPVHLCGGMTALVAAIMVKPREGRFTKEGSSIGHGNSVNALLGLFILWWGWLGFNCGSTFGISGGKWKLAARSATTTILASCGGGSMAFLLSFLIHRGKFDIFILVDGILGALVSITGICAVTTTWAAVLIGAVGAAITTGAVFLLVKLKIDDPVGASAVHFAGSIWGMISCGLFTKKDNIEFTFSQNDGLFWGGGFYLLGVQCLAILSICTWAVITSLIILKGIDLTIGLRMTLEEELYGADFFEHAIDSLPEVQKHAEEVLRTVSAADRKKPAYTKKKTNENSSNANGEVQHDDEQNRVVNTENSKTNTPVHSNSNGHSSSCNTIKHPSVNGDEPKKSNLLTRFKGVFHRGSINGSKQTYHINEAFTEENESNSQQ